jgi:hypothetical protein
MAHMTHPPTEILPPTLQYLGVEAQDIAIYDWLAGFPYYQQDLPKLEKVV